MVTVRKSFAQTMREQMEAEQEQRYNLQRQRLEWSAEYRAAHPEQAMATPYSQPVWVSPDGTTRLPVTYRSNREAAIERAARRITNERYILASGPRAEYLRWQGWRLTPDDGEPGDGRVWCVECRRLHFRGAADCPITQEGASA